MAGSNIAGIEQNKWQVKEIVDHKTVGQLRAMGIIGPFDYKDTFVRFRVRWNGYEEKDDTWECPKRLVKNEIYIKYCQEKKLRRQDGKPYKRNSLVTSLVDEGNRHEEGPACAICLNSFQTILKSGHRLASTLCGHVFCLCCINAALQVDVHCPKCRRIVNIDDIRPIFL